MERFLQETKYIDYNSDIIQQEITTLFSGETGNLDKVKIAYEFVRDTIPHSFDCDAKYITAKASDVLKYKTGICFAKANLLAALLRSQGIPTGICYQRLTLADDDSEGYCIHAYNAVFLKNKWVKMDARGNKPGINAQFSLNTPILAFPVRSEYDECFYPGIYASPYLPTMRILEAASCIQDVWDNLPTEVTQSPDIVEDM